MQKRIYLDNNGSSPPDFRITDYLAEMLPQLTGNPSSIHADGRTIRSLVTKARDTIAAFLGVKPKELIFTSGGTECANIALRSLAAAKPKGHIITSMAEHSSVFAVCKELEASGHPVSFLEPGEAGTPSPDDIKKAIRPDTCLIALMAANNETGVLSDIPSIAAIAQAHAIPYYVDAVALIGKDPVVIPAGVTAMGFSGHKVHALQGIGVLYVRSGVPLKPLFFGGAHEQGRRAGTENVLGILSLGKAIEVLSQEQMHYYEMIRKMRDRFEKRLLDALPNVVVNGTGARVSNVSNLAFDGIDGETLLMQLDRAGISASHGSACSSGALEPSRVLLSMGLPLERVRSSIRFSLSRLTTEEEIDEACDRIVKIIR